MKNKIFIVGSSGHAKVITSVLEELNFEILGYIDSFAEAGTTVGGYKILGDENILLNAKEIFNCLNVAIGIGENNGRKEVIEKIKALNSSIKFPNIIAKTAHVADNCNIGIGTVILRNAVVNDGCSIGNHCIINTAAIVEHDCNLADFVSIASNAVLGGAVEVG